MASWENTKSRGYTPSTQNVLGVVRLGYQGQLLIKQWWLLPVAFRFTRGMRLTSRAFGGPDVFSQDPSSKEGPAEAGPSPSYPAVM